MKKKVEIYVQGCDDCERHDVELKTCIGCGVTLCTFCASDRGDKYSMSTHNKYGCDSFRTFYDFKYDDEISFCLECMMHPKKHKVSRLLDLCIKKDSIYVAHKEDMEKYDNKMADIKDKIYDKTLTIECKHHERFWKVKDYNSLMGGEEVR